MTIASSARGTVLQSRSGSRVLTKQEFAGDLDNAQRRRRKLLPRWPSRLGMAGGKGYSRFWPEIS